MAKTSSCLSKVRRNTVLVSAYIGHRVLMKSPLLFLFGAQMDSAARIFVQPCAMLLTCSVVAMRKNIMRTCTCLNIIHSIYPCTWITSEPPRSAWAFTRCNWIEVAESSCMHWGL